MPFIQNQLSKKFVEVAKGLKSRGQVKEYAEIADVIGWDRTALSNAMNARRNVPPEYAKLLQDKFHVKIILHTEEDLLSDILTRLVYVEAAVETFESAIGGLLTIDTRELKTAGDFMEKVAKLRQAVEDAAKRRFQKVK